jgi:hypothetical protein
LETFLQKEQLAQLAAACDWLEFDRGRDVRYRLLIEEFFEEDAGSRQHILAYGESCEIVRLFELWEHRSTDFPGLAGKIKAVVAKGPVPREEENPATSSNRARDDAFSYLVAGRLRAFLSSPLKAQLLAMRPVSPKLTSLFNWVICL